MGGSGLEAKAQIDKHLTLSMGRASGNLNLELEPPPSEDESCDDEAGIKPSRGTAPLCRLRPLAGRVRARNAAGRGVAAAGRRGSALRRRQPTTAEKADAVPFSSPLGLEEETEDDAASLRSRDEDDVSGDEFSSDGAEANAETMALHAKYGKVALEVAQKIAVSFVAEVVEAGAVVALTKQELSRSSDRTSFVQKVADQFLSPPSPSLNSTWSPAAPSPTSFLEEDVINSFVEKRLSMDVGVADHKEDPFTFLLQAAGFGGAGFKPQLRTGGAAYDGLGFPSTEALLEMDAKVLRGLRKGTRVMLVEIWVLLCARATAMSCSLRFRYRSGMILSQ